MIRTATLLSGGASLVLALAASGHAQTPGAEPEYGSERLRSGFTDDPRSFEARAGGAIAASRASSECSGYIAEAPGFALDYRADEGSKLSLHLSAASDADTTLAVRTPSGEWRCDDDGGAGPGDPGVKIDAPESGLYEIWIGTYQAGAGYPPAMLHISEIGFHDDNPLARRPDPEAEPGETLQASAGFPGDPLSVEVAQGGPARMSDEPMQCFGWAGEAPSARLSYEAGEYPLFISTRSEDDGVLAVQTPSGEWLCDDDGAGDLDPGLRFDDPESGDYLIWAGTLSDLGGRRAELFVSEVGFAGVDDAVDVSAEPRFGAHSLQSGFSPDPAAFEIEAGGDLDASRAVEGHTVAEGWCNGQVTREPTLRLDYEGGDAPLNISAVSDADTTLMVNTPDGAWWCDDDSAGDLDPGLRIAPAAEGVYDVYVGTYGGQTADAEVFVSETGWGADALPNAIDPEAGPLFGEISLEAGFTPDPHELDVEAGGPLAASSAGLDGADWCAGHITREPTARLDWTGGDGPLAIHLESIADTTLAVQAPDSAWRCDDDGGPGVNAGLEFERAQSGVYRIHAGLYGGGEPEQARLMISEAGLPRE